MPSTYLIQCLELCKSTSKNKDLLVNRPITPILLQFGGRGGVELGKQGR